MVDFCNCDLHVLILCRISSICFFKLYNKFAWLRRTSRFVRFRSFPFRSTSLRSASLRFASFPFPFPFPFRFAMSLCTICPVQNLCETEGFLTCTLCGKVQKEVVIFETVTAQHLYNNYTLTDKTKIDKSKRLCYIKEKVKAFLCLEDYLFPSGTFPFINLFFLKQ